MGLLAGSGAEPHRFTHSRPHSGPPRLRQARTAAASRAAGQGDVAARLPDTTPSTLIAFGP